MMHARLVLLLAAVLLLATPMVTSVPTDFLDPAAAPSVEPGKLGII
jgi:hypothetical protein